METGAASASAMLVNLHSPDPADYESAYGAHSGAGHNRRTQISRSLTRRAITQGKKEKGTKGASINEVRTDRERIDP